MKRIYFLIPFLGLTAFAGYYRHWNASHEAAHCRCRQEPFGEYAHRDGRRDAENAIARGRLVILTYGLPAPWSLEYREVLKRDYDIEVRAVAGCVVTDPLLNYVQAYDEVMDRHIAATLGKEVFNDARTKAEALHAQRQPRTDPPALGSDPSASDT